jgi:hypothetical protein
MQPTGYTDIVARFTDGLAAEALVKFISAAGIPCDVMEIWDPVRPERYAVRVLRSKIAELRRVLKLKPVATRLSPLAAQLLAGRLARENVPCYVAGEHSPGLFGDSDSCITETKEMGDIIAVPEPLFALALRILNVSSISEQDLPQLALRAGPGDQELT